MIKRLLVNWIVMAVAIGLVAALLPGVSVRHAPFSFLWISALFALVNLVLGTILRFLTAPVMVATLGLFGIVINALMFRVTAWGSDSLSVDGFGTALLAALLITAVVFVLRLTPWGRAGRKTKAKAKAKAKAKSA